MMRTRDNLLKIGLLFLLAAVVLPVIAQETGPEVAGEIAETAENAVKETNLWELIKMGGPLMFVLFGLSVATVALAVYGFMSVPEKKMLTPHLVPQLQEALDELDLEKARNVCTQNPSLLTNILSAGLQRIDNNDLDVAAMEKAMEEAAVEEAATGIQTISYLSIVAQLSPMVGLLGTVTGMIKAFGKISEGAMGKPDALAGDIGEAMVTTASGLIIGIPAMFLYFYLKSRYTSNVARLGRILGNLAHNLVSAAKRQVAAASGEYPIQPGAVLTDAE